MTLEEKIKSLPDGEKLFIEDTIGGYSMQATDLTTDDIKRMVEALKHYADEGNWLRGNDSESGTRQVYAPDDSINGFDIAQNALK